MPLPAALTARARAAQQAAAHDPAAQIRLVAGPGTGKSATIEEHVSWLLSQGAAPGSISAVSFTRASATDLRLRIHTCCAAQGHSGANDVRVSTLHSLALRTLRAAGLLTAYPADPLVLDRWELKNVFDAEFRHAHGFGWTRAKEIRTDHEAFWSTGAWTPPNYVPPKVPITSAERKAFNAFHLPRTQTYSCVLPGEIVRACVAHIKAGTLSAAALLGIEHLVVDEFQDLNPLDLEFVEAMINEGARVLVAGDDDQSIYSFRFADPAGLQTFPTRYPSCAQHTLRDCFRSTPNVLSAAAALIAAHQQPGRIPKTLVSLYQSVTPPLQGIVHRWRFASGIAEAKAVAISCRDLVGAGVSPHDILILISNKREQLPLLLGALESAEVPCEQPLAERFSDSDAGRCVLAVLRIVSDPDDYVAHRVLLGIRHGVGVGTSAKIADAVILNNLNYRALFYQPLPTGVFTGLPLRALASARAVCAQIQSWQAADTVAARSADILTLVGSAFSPTKAGEWQTFAATVPGDMTLSEMRDYIWCESDEQHKLVLEAVYLRLGLEVPEAGLLPSRVRLMTMHGAKGLSAKVVFIPGLEQELLPGPKRRPFPGLVLEAARLLYVSITRARAVCVLSFADNRMVHGKFRRRTPSMFTTTLGAGFSSRRTGLSAAELATATSEVASL